MTNMTKRQKTAALTIVTIGALALFTQNKVAGLAAPPALIATATLDQALDLAGLNDILENGLSQSVLGGIGSGLAYAAGTTFLGVPDRGPNATAIPNGNLNDNTTSFISRVETLDLSLAPSNGGSLPFSLTPTLKATTLLYSPTPLIYGNTPGLTPQSGVPVANAPGKYYFTGRSDNFLAPGTLSTDPHFARLDPEAIRISRDGKTVFVADEYGPYVYQFDRATGRRIRSYTLPDHFAITNLSALGATEIAGNTIGRVTNKGMEGLSITPDGQMLVGLMQSPLLQDGGDGGRANRIVTIDIASGATHEYVYDNKIGSKAFNSSEIIALNDHQFLIDTRDGKGLGDGSPAVIKQLWAVDIAGAQDVSGLSGEATLLTRAVPKVLFLNMVTELTGKGILDTDIPAKIEGLAFGQYVVLNGVLTHTLYVANDNDFVPNVAGPSRWYVFGFTDDYLASLHPGGLPQVTLSYTPQIITVISDVSVDTPMLWPPNGKMRTVKVNYSVSDSRPSVPARACSLAVSSNEGPGATPDWEVVDAHTILLRAEREGKGQGRVYSIAIRCTDSGGAVSGASASVLVPHNQ